MTDAVNRFLKNMWLTQLYNVFIFYVPVCELKNPSMTAFLSGLEGSGWLKHISAILETSVFIANVSNGPNSSFQYDIQ